MTNQKGTRWETAIVDYLRPYAPWVERRARSGAKDRGDIAGLPGVVTEAKSANRIELSTWVDEAETERVNDGAKVAAVWIKRRGKTSPGDGYVVLKGSAWVDLLILAGYIPEPSFVPDLPPGELD